jgi:hypothetical protein
VSESLLGRQSLLSSHYKLLAKAGIPHPTIVHMKTMAKDLPINRWRDVSASLPNIQSRNPSTVVT